MALTVSGSSQELAPSGWSNETVAPCRCATCKMCNVRDNTVGLSMEPAMFRFGRRSQVTRACVPIHYYPCSG